jgi:alpha-beta hydrolase superfamily lysophospholipase
MKSQSQLERVTGLVFTAAITIVSRTLIVRDRLLGRMKRTSNSDPAGQNTSRHWIARDDDKILDAVFVTPARDSAKAALLICHGIGETVDHWLTVQNLLASHGIASLIFDYAGYGKSTGSIGWKQCEDDTVAAFRFLKALLPHLPVSVLGFSMGSGIASAVLDRIVPDHLILCSSFTSFRAAALTLGVPRRLSSLVPPIWNTLESLPHCSSPVLILHCEQDRVFPTQMALDLASCCDPHANLVIIPNHQHNEPFYRPQLRYWNHVVSHLVSYHR